jgi:hypothetical protein
LDGRSVGGLCDVAKSATRGQATTERAQGGRLSDVAYKQAFLEAASKIESGEIKDQEAWTKFIADNAGAKQREALDRVYEAIDKLDLPASFAGKESEIAKVNREIAGAW